jgi:hypothetical protein
MLTTTSWRTSGLLSASWTKKKRRQGGNLLAAIEMDRLAELEVAQIELRREDSYEISR